MMKTVFFTGATGCLGMLCVTKLSKLGWMVFASGTNEGKLAELAKLRNVIAIKADITDPGSLEDARGIVKTHTDGLDAVVNFAGLSAFTSMIEGDPEGITKKILEVNVMGPVKVNHIFFEMLLKAKGRIINCSSEAGWMKAQPFAAPYYMSKRALEAYNDSLRRELMYLGIPVIKLQPGPFDTPMTEGIIKDYQEVLQGTKYYTSVLLKMKVFLTQGLRQECSTDGLVSTVVRALEDPRPRLVYRTGTSKLLLLLELLPDRLVDWIYRKLVA